MAEVITHFSTWPWQHWATERPSAAALSFGEQSFSWHEVSERIEQYAQGLIEQGIKRDQLVAAIAPNSVHLVWLFLATIRIGARYVGLNPRFSDIELNAILDELKPQAIWLPPKSSFIPQQQDDACSSVNVPQILRLLPAIQPRLVPVTWQPSRAVTYTLTSGSTGLPKAVVHTAEQHLASADGLLSLMSFTPGDSWLLSLPLYHVSGMAIVWRWLHSGAAIVIPKSADLADELRQVTHASLVPTQLQRLLDNTQEPNQAWQLKEVLLGGAVIPPSLTEQAEQAGIACWCGYGMTEMASTVTVKRADRSSGVGHVIPHRELMVKEGEIFVRGASLCLGYYRNQMIFPATEGEWFSTRDLGEWQNDELVILGRADNMFISGGENIQPETVEKVLTTHPKVQQAFVLPRADDEYGQRPVAIITTALPLDAGLVNELELFMAEQVTGFKRPVSYLTFPEHLSGRGIKVSRSQLQQWLDEQSYPNSTK
ncbi:o-succinylbenzoate--CoA ligase [Photobacterium kagoshimensis]|uniref:o-succinylbenzoate--CoA ligase n=1 Tax=Photobacterium kagoshimensis TaxID=2910242 RepID=UPI003D0C102B